MPSASLCDRPAGAAAHRRGPECCNRVRALLHKPPLLHAPQLDSWSAGALAYDVLCGRAPFALHEGIGREEETRHILESDPTFPSGLSYHAVGFMMQVGWAACGGGAGRGAG